MPCTVGLMSALYRSDKTVKMWKIPRPCNTFRQKFDHINQQVHGISCMDDLLRGKHIFTPASFLLRACALLMPRPTVTFTLVKYLIPVCNHIGLLSKSKGQIIRIAATLHVVFNIETPLAIPTVISDAAIKAAINLVNVCIQHAAFLAGRGDVEETVKEMMKGE